MQRLIDAYNHATTMEGIALNTAMVLPALVLQRPHAKSKSKDHSTRSVERVRRWAELRACCMKVKQFTADYQAMNVRGTTMGSWRSVEKLVAQGT